MEDKALEYEIGSNQEYIRIRGRQYDRVESDLGRLVFSDGNDTWFAHRYESEKTKNEVTTKLFSILMKDFAPSECEDCDYDEDYPEFKANVINEVAREKKYRRMIFPLYNVIVDDLYSVSEAPLDLAGMETTAFAIKYCTMDKAIFNTNCPLHIRVLTALNFVESVVTVFETFNSVIQRITPKAFWVNPENGDVRVFVEKLLDCYDDEPEPDFLVAVKSKTDSIGESELSRFIAYTVFRLFCVDNPFDGRDTLVKYPLLTEKALREINSGEHEFIFEGKSNGYSEYIGVSAYQKWKILPPGLQCAIRRELTKQRIDEKQIAPIEWLRKIRNLRDCLIFQNEKRRFVFCNPEEWPDLLFLVTSDHYVIPVWPRKAIYWYHVGNDEDLGNNGVIAGINEDSEIENRSDDEWVISYKDKERFLSKGRSIEAKDSEVITIFDKEFTVVRGDSVRQFLADMETKPDEKQKTSVEVGGDNETENNAGVESEPEKIPEVEVETDTIVDTEDETEVKAVLVVSEKNVSENNTEEDIVEDEVERKTEEGIQLICSDVKSSTILIE